MEHVTGKRYPVNPENYKLCEEIGDGVSATVYRAVCIPLDENVAIKVLDLEKCNNNLDGIRHEVQTMRVIDHPNVLRAHCSFTAGHNLWVVMPYMAAGSCLHIMKSSYPDGFEEPVIVTLLREVLKALVYLHAHGHIHRDVKSGNILIDSNGDVKLGDFGVSACMFDTGDRQRSRNTFVGTPCWMAPEVMQQLHGYDFKADVWSFGITALELAHGHAPFSKYPPMKVLLMTLQNAPPGLDYERDKKFSKSFKEMVATCLVKDPKKRPTSEKLLKHHFFKHVRSNEYLACTILNGLPPLGDRYRMLKAKEADLLAQNKSQYENEHLSQQEYIRGISAWNFNLEDLKSQAALIQDDDDDINDEDPDESEKQKERSNVVLFGTESPPPPERSIYAHDTTSHEDAFSDLHDLESSLDSFPVRPLQALKGCFDVGEDVNAKDPSDMVSEQLLPHSSLKADDQKNEERGQGCYLPRLMMEQKSFHSGSLLSGSADRDLAQPKNQAERNYSGPLLYRQRRDTNNASSGDDVSEGPVVQRKGRFQVTSADLSAKGPSDCTDPAWGASTVIPTASFAAGSVLPSLQCILQQNAMQREEIVKLIKQAEQISGRHSDSAEMSTDDLLQITPASARERELQSQIINLQRSIGTLAEELQRQKSINSQLETQLIALGNKEGKD